MLRFGIQQIFVPLQALIFGMVALAPFAPSADGTGLTGVLSLLYALPSVVGFVLAYLVNMKWRQWHLAGRWVWILPSLAWLEELLFVQADMPFVDRLARDFAPTGSNEGVNLFLGTIPTLACLFYSIGMFMLNRKPSAACVVSKKSTCR